MAIFICYLPYRMPGNTGEIKGIKARGGFQVDMAWANKKLVTAKIISGNGGICKIRTAVKIKVKGVRINTEHTAYGYVTSFSTQKGKVYQLSANTIHNYKHT